MGKFILILGGQRSGKSSFACRLASQLGSEIVYLATCQPQDDEMRKRIEKHKKERPKNWLTIEEPRNLISALDRIKLKDVIIIDCITLFITNLLMSGCQVIPEEIKRLAQMIRKVSGYVIVISNETNLGIIPESSLARKFADIAGCANQILASYADEVFFMIAGIPNKVK
jgi:adenosylcobinamide kinase/adenosylcobinamide-phosphate guanylyltransferase